jgi:hypothetical protein
MTTPGLKDFIEQVGQSADGIYAGHDQHYEHMPMAFALVGGEMIVIGIALDTEDWRTGVRNLFESLALRGATMLVHVHESWMAKLDPKDPARTVRVMRQVHEGGVASLPPDDREEVLMIEGVTSSGERFLGHRRIDRGRAQVALGQFQSFPDDKRSTSRFLDNMPWRLT